MNTGYTGTICSPESLPSQTYATGLEKYPLDRQARDQISRHNGLEACHAHSGKLGSRLQAHISVAVPRFGSKRNRDPLVFG